MSNHTDEVSYVYNSITEYCNTYNIPRENLFEILEDQKVLPMIRGKATEYIGAVVLRKSLDPREWLVDKLNLNPQSTKSDVDVRITFKRTGAQLTAETKNAVRASFTLGTPTLKQPHFKVKCHRSRSHLTKKTNDRYILGDFDILLCNVSNAIFRGKSLERGLPLIDNVEVLTWLKNFYKATTDDALRRCTYDDWRVCLPHTIAEKDDTIPRNPRIQMEDDPNWFTLDELTANLGTLIEQMSDK